MHEFFQIKAAVAPLALGFGFLEEAGSFAVDELGSMQCLFVRGHLRFRLRWDGPDGRGLAELLSDDVWTEVEAEVPESEESLFRQRVERLCLRLGERLRGAGGADPDSPASRGGGGSPGAARE